jgi:outer membrane protein TolC
VATPPSRAPAQPVVLGGLTSSHRPTQLRSIATTFSRRLLLGLIFCGPAHAAESEVNLIRRVLSGSVTTADVAAAGADARAKATAPAHPNPELDVRHEEARGPAGATTDAVGGSISIDLGLSGLVEARAAHLRGQAGSLRRTAVVLESLCDARRDSTELWAATQRVAAITEAHDRVLGLSESLAALAMAGEASGYDRDRAALSAAAHSLDQVGAEGDLATHQAHLSVLTGSDVTRVDLVPVGPLPSLESAQALLADHPELAALRFERDAAVRSISAARRSALPDLTVSGGARWDAAPNGPATPGMEIGGSIEAPLFDWSRGRVRRVVADQALADAAYLHREAELSAAIHSAWARASFMEEFHEGPDPQRVWSVSVDRYHAGETSLEELLQIAEDVESAVVSATETQRLNRLARIDLSCATGRFHEPAIQAVFEEALR